MGTLDSARIAIALPILDADRPLGCSAAVVELVFAVAVDTEVVATSPTLPREKKTDSGEEQQRYVWREKAVPLLLRHRATQSMPGTRKEPGFLYSNY